MKNIFLLLILAFSYSCSKDEEKSLPRNADLKFTVTSNDNSDNRQSGIITSLIAKGNDTIFSDKSNLGNNFPFDKAYDDQPIDKGSSIELLYVDFTIPSLNGTYKPYGVTLTILVDGEPISSEVFELETIGEIVSTSYIYE